MNNKEKVKKNGKKINLIDVLIVVIALIVIAAVITFVIALVTDGTSLFGKNRDAESNVQYTLLVSELDTELYSIVKGADSVAGCPSLQIGDAVYDRASGEKIGTVSALTYRDCVRSTGAFDENNNLEYADYPGCVDLFITVEAYSDPDEEGCTVSGVDIRIGSELSFRTYGFYADGDVIELGEIKATQESGK